MRIQFVTRFNALCQTERYFRELGAYAPALINPINHWACRKLLWHWQSSVVRYYVIMKQRCRR